MTSFCRRSWQIIISRVFVLFYSPLILFSSTLLEYMLSIKLKKRMYHGELATNRKTRESKTFLAWKLEARRHWTWVRGSRAHGILCKIGFQEASSPEDDTSSLKWFLDPCCSVYCLRGHPPLPLKSPLFEWVLSHRDLPWKEFWTCIQCCFPKNCTPLIGGVACGETATFCFDFTWSPRVWSRTGGSFWPWLSLGHSFGKDWERTKGLQMELPGYSKARKTPCTVLLWGKSLNVISIRTKSRYTSIACSVFGEVLGLLYFGW